ncbi:LVIVD repeat-containing protein, partial [Trichloromonas sp.]|uniref:LVIVD repeat-containing protein n=1 Tax=Trichloromonas sp. TaxID=3069249 RepID=UPI003D8168E4
MKIRKRTLAIILLAVVAYLGMVIGLALPLISRYSMHEELQLIAVSSSRNKVGQPVHLTVEGAGFGKKTNFMLSLDSGNQQAIVYDSETSWPIDTILKIGSTLYLGDRDRKVHRFDISRPDRPEYQISYSLGDRPTALAEIDGSPWAASGYGEIGPLGERAARPVETIVDFTGDAEGVLYAAAARQGLVVFRQKNGTAVKIGALALPGSALSIAVAGNTAYVASVRGGLHICDISSPETPRLLSTLPLAGNNQALAVKDTRVFLSSADQFTVIDVQNRLQPRVLAQLPLTKANAIVIHNNLALLAAGSAGLLAVDISDPARPFLAGHLTPGDVIRCLAVAGDRAYLGTGSAGLLVVDLNRLSLNPEWRPGPLHAPKSKVELTKALRRHATSLWGELAAQAEIQLPPGCYAADAARIGPATYLATDCGLLILDRDQPGRLQVRQQPLAFAGEIAVDGSTAYVSGGRQSTELKPASKESNPGLQVFDVSEPAQPR